MTDPTPAEAIEGRAQEMLQSLIGNHYSDTTLRVATDWLRQERRLALSPPDAGEVRTYREGVEDAARIVETTPERVLEFWDRPGGPPGNGWRPLTRADLAAAIRKLP